MVDRPEPPPTAQRIPKPWEVFGAEDSADIAYHPDSPTRDSKPLSSPPSGAQKDGLVRAAKEVGHKDEEDSLVAGLLSLSIKQQGIII